MDPELLAAMEAIENEEWSGEEHEEGFIPDDFVQQAIEDREEDAGFDFDAHIRNLLKAREERERSKVELTEDRYAEEIRLEPTRPNGLKEPIERKEREIDQQFSAVGEREGWRVDRSSVQRRGRRRRGGSARRTAPNGRCGVSSGETGKP